MGINRSLGVSAVLVLALFVTATAVAGDAPVPDGVSDGAQVAEGASEAPASDGEATGYRNVELTGSDRSHRMDDKRDYRNLIIAGPQFAMIVIPAGVFVRYHRLISDTLSLQLGLGYAGFKTDDVKFSGLRVMGGADFHPVGNGMHGFYVGPRVNYRRWGINVEGGGSGSISTMNVVGIGGYRAIWDPGFSLGIGLGGGYGFSVAEATARDADGNDASVSGNLGSGFVFALEFTLGWAF